MNTIGNGNYDVRISRETCEVNPGKANLSIDEQMDVRLVNRFQSEVNQMSDMFVSLDNTPGVDGNDRAGSVSLDQVKNRYRNGSGGTSTEKVSGNASFDPESGEITGMEAERIQKGGRASDKITVTADENGNKVVKSEYIDKDTAIRNCRTMTFNRNGTITYTSDLFI